MFRLTASGFDLTDNDQIISVSEALRTHYGTIQVRGMITSLTRLFKMISGVKFFCDKCQKVIEITYPLPIFSIQKYGEKCTRCDTTVSTEKLNPDFVNTVCLELQDLESFNDLDRLSVFLFDKDTENVRIGEIVLIEGEMHIDNHKDSRKLFPFCYSKSIQYDRIDKISLSKADIDAVRRFTTKNPSSIVEELVKMFDPSIIGFEHVKKGLLLCAVNTDSDNVKGYGSNDGRRGRIHSLLIGETGLAKSKFLRAVKKLIPNSRYESGQNSSGKSLTAIVSKEVENYMLRLGPASLAKNAICSINEFGRTRLEDQAHLLDIMEEGKFTINKHGINATIEATTTLIFSANPISGSTWDHDERIEIDEIPALKPIIDRIDLPFVFRNTKDEDLIRKYAILKSEFETKKIPDYSNYLIKHLEYAKKLNPKISDEAKTMFSEFFVSIKVRNPNFGSNRILDTLFRVSKAFARLKLKKIVDEDDAKDTIEFYNVQLAQYQQLSNVPLSPRNVAYNECISILRDIKSAIALEELLKHVCQKNSYVKHYFCFSNGNLRLSDNIKVRIVYEMLLNHSNIRRVQEKPVVLQWYSSEYDVYDTYDINKTPKTDKDEHEENVSSSSFPHRSQTSQDNNSSNIDNVSHRPDKLINKWGRIFHLCPISGCNVSNIHLEEIDRHLKLKHNINHDAQK
jgi:replicative DNA helicase Mcm